MEAAVSTLVLKAIQQIRIHVSSKLSLILFSGTTMQYYLRSRRRIMVVIDLPNAGRNRREVGGIFGKGRRLESAKMGSVDRSR